MLGVKMLTLHSFFTECERFIVLTTMEFVLVS